MTSLPILISAQYSFLVLIAANALGIGAASFASVSGTSFGDGDEVTEPVEVPSPYLEGARRKYGEQRYSGKPDGDSRNAQKKTTDNGQQSTDLGFKV